MRPAAGDEVFQSTDAEQPCGAVAQAEAVPNWLTSNGFDATVVLYAAAADAGDLHLNSATGPRLHSVKSRPSIRPENRDR